MMEKVHGERVYWNGDTLQSSKGKKFPHIFQHLPKIPFEAFLWYSVLLC